jgi:DUF1680 family protein
MMNDVQGAPMNRRSFIKTAGIATLVSAGAPLSFAALEPADEKKSATAPAGQGFLHDRYELTLKRVLSGDSPAYTEEFLLADVRPDPVRRFTEYSGDLSGRYIGALATASTVYGVHFPGLDTLVEQTIALQKSDGYFGSTFHYDQPTDDDLALLWGNGRLLVGLLEYDRLKPSPQVKSTCRRLGDFLLRIGPLMLSNQIRDSFDAKHFSSSYICWMQQTEGLANLYMATGDERYRKLAEDIAAVITRRPGDHVHGYLTSLRGVMDLYKATGDARFLEQCEAAWDDVHQSQDQLITGGVPEGWSPNKHRTEGCAEADWVRLSLSLWKSTGNQKYLALAERAIFNELAFNQFATGDFGHRLYSETGLPADGAVRAWWCCTLHGLRCFPDIHTSVFRWQDGGLWFDMPIDSRIETDTLSAASVSSLAEDGTIRIRVLATGKSSASVHIRKPEWAREVLIRINGSAREFPSNNGFVDIHRPWTAGDTIEMKYAMQLRSEPSGENRTAYTYGPWLLGAPAADNPRYFNELTANNRLIPGTVHSLSTTMQPARPFTVPIAATVVGYISAEFHDQPGTAVLRAVAEQTGQATTAWELRFLTQEQG